MKRIAAAFLLCIAAGGARAEQASVSTAPYAPQVMTFTSSGSYPVPSWAKVICAEEVGGAGGGGGGPLEPAGTASSPGAGGGAPGYLPFTCKPASLLPSMLTVTVGAGGLAGLGATSSSTAGGNGLQGGDTWVTGFPIACAGGGASGGSTGNAFGGSGGSVGTPGYCEGRNGTTTAGGNGRPGAQQGSTANATENGNLETGAGGGGGTPGSVGLGGNFTLGPCAGTSGGGVTSANVAEPGANSMANPGNPGGGAANSLFAACTGHGGTAATGSASGGDAAAGGGIGEGGYGGGSAQNGAVRAGNGVAGGPGAARIWAF